MRANWWKILAVLLVLYTIIAGLLLKVPALPILHETIRNLYFHVPMWFSMMIIMTVSLVFSIRYLSGFKISNDIVASEAVHTGLMLGVLGLLTGMLWGNYTWGSPWPNDPKLHGAAIAILIYLAYMILRSSMDDEQKKARVSAVYNIFAYTMLIVFLMILPRVTDSLHPGNGGNPAFDTYDLDNTMRMVFFPAVIGWTLLGVWIMSIRLRIKKINRKLLYG